jgi:hypothetical protein
MKDLHARGWESPEAALVKDANVAVRLVDGRVFVGVVAALMADTEKSVRIRLWGRVATMAVPLHQIAQARILREYTWEERREVAGRQKRGEPPLARSFHAAVSRSFVNPGRVLESDSHCWY